MKKKIALLMATVMLFGVTVGATIAYLTSTTKVVNNTFKVGDIKITLDEEKVDEYGEDDVSKVERVYGNEYKLIPGHTYKKDPTVHVQPKSENCYVFVKVVNGITGIEVAAEDGDTIAEQMEAKGWKALGTEANVYYYVGTGDAANQNGLVVNTLNNTTLDLVVFENFTIATDANVDSYATAGNADAVVTIVAYAVQSDSFDTAAEAWGAAPSNWIEG